MEYIPFAIIAVVLIAGIVTLALGFRTWHPANTTAGILVLLASCGFLTLASIRGQRERAWTTMVRQWETKLLEVRDVKRADPQGSSGLADLGSRSLDALQNYPIPELEMKQKEWSRALDRVNLWRGRFWSGVTFAPPKVAKDELVKERDQSIEPGKIAISAPASPSVSEGSELYVFDAKPVAEGGRFIGGFRVTQVTPVGDPVSSTELSILPLGRIDATDLARWTAPHDAVVAYENLPFDRWVAFHRTGRDADATVIPEPKKELPEEGPLRTAVERHDFPEGLLDPAGEEAGSPFPEDPDTPPPGVEWASIEFDEDFDWKPEGSDGSPEGALMHFRAGERLSAFPAADVAALRKAGAAFKHAWSIPPGLFWAEVEFQEGYSVERSGADPIEFAAGDVARLPLEEAEKLEKKGTLSIKRRLHRRPLNAAESALRGVAAVDRLGRPTTEPGEGGIAVGSLGIDRLSEDLRMRIAALDRNKQEIVEAHEAAEDQLNSLQDVKGKLESDLGNWGNDSTAAEGLANEAARSFETVKASLEASERAIAELGSRLKKLTSTLATEIDRRNPPPEPSRPSGG